MTSESTAKTKGERLDRIPRHTLALVLCLLISSFIFFPSIESIDALAKHETFTHRSFPDLISVKALSYIRAAIAIFGFWVSVGGSLSTDPLNLRTSYLPESKLTQSVIRLQGISIQFPYTSWCWNILSLSFALNAYIAATPAAEVPRWLLRVAFLLYETATPNTLLVSFVVKYAIWPTVLKTVGESHTLAAPRALTQHNLNTVIAVVEVAFLGGIPVQQSHMSLAVIFGTIYVFFTWSMMNRWDAKHPGPHFLYFFFDVTLPGFSTSIAIAALLMVMIVFYSLFAAAASLLGYVGDGFATHGLFVLGLSALVCRFTNMKSRFAIV